MDIPNPSEFDAATASPKFKCRHLVYEIFQRSDQLRDIDETSTVDGMLVSSEVDGVESEDGVCQTLRIREASLSASVPPFIVGAEVKNPDAQVGRAEHFTRMYFVEAAKKEFNEEDGSYEITNDWEPFTAMVVSHTDDGTLCLELLNPETGNELDLIDEITLLDVLRAMDDSLREEMVYQMVITQPVAGETDAIEHDYGHEFDPALFIAGHTCEKCERTSSYCVHNGNLN